MNYFQIKSFLSHWLTTVDEHSVHSPFFFDFYTKVVKHNEQSTDYSKIEETRKKLLSDTTEIRVVDLGATSTYFNSEKRKISQVAATSLNDQKFAELFVRIIRYLDSKKIVELGTSMGITTLYLAKKENVFVTTFEGDKTIASIAQTNFEFFNKKNIKLIEGNINETLPEFLQTPQKIDLVLIDANHRYQPTINYFNWLAKRMADKGVIIIDDIYRSDEMAKAWQELKNHELIYGSIDFFRCGILFFDLSLNKQQFIWTL